MLTLPNAETEVPRARPGKLAGWVSDHRLVAFFVGAYGFSWVLWTPAALGYDGAVGMTVFFVGVLGPVASAATVTHLSGGSVKRWARSIFHVQFARRWWLFALGLPFAVAR